MGNWGAFLLWSGFGFVFLILLFITWAAPDILPFLPLVFLGGAGLVVLFHYPLLNLGVVMSSFVLIVGFSAGLGVGEALYGLYYLSFWPTGSLRGPSWMGRPSAGDGRSGFCCCS